MPPRYTFRVSTQCSNDAISSPYSASAVVTTKPMFKAMWKITALDANNDDAIVKWSSAMDPTNYHVYIDPFCITEIERQDTNDAGEASQLYNLLHYDNTTLIRCVAAAFDDSKTFNLLVEYWTGIEFVEWYKFYSVNVAPGASEDRRLRRLSPETSGSSSPRRLAFPANPVSLIAPEFVEDYWVCVKGLTGSCTVGSLVERFDIELFSYFPAK